MFVTMRNLFISCMRIYIQLRILPSFYITSTSEVSYKDSIVYQIYLF